MDNNFIKLLKNLHPNTHKEAVKDLLTQKENIIHEINDITILNIKENIYLINKQSFSIELIENEEKAVNKALDFHKSSKNIQTEMF